MGAERLEKENCHGRFNIGKHFQDHYLGRIPRESFGCRCRRCPAGLPLSEEDIQKYLDRRKPGTSAITTQRKEADQVELLSGIFEGKTTGTPISLMVRNTSQISADYTEIAENYRPGHADYCFDAKYGFRDYRGGGRSPVVRPSDAWLPEPLLRRS